MKKNNIGMLLAAAATVGAAFNSNLTVNEGVPSLESYEGTYKDEFVSYEAKASDEFKVQNIDMSPAQQRAFNISMGIGQDPKVTAKGISNVSLEDGEFQFGNNYSAMGVPSLEHFDGSRLDKVQKYTATFNVMALEQDPFGSLFFRPLVVDAATTSVKATANVFSIENEMIVDKKGGASKFEKLPILKALRDGELIKDNDVIIPIAKTGALDNSGYLISESEKSVTYRGEDVNTAHIKVNEDTSLVVLSKTTAQLNGDNTERTDALSKALSVKSLFAKLAYNDGADKTAYFEFDIENQLGANFTETAQGHSKDLTLDRAKVRASIKVGTTSEFGKASASTVFDAIGNGYTINVELSFSGNANAATGSAMVSPTGKGIKLVSVVNAGGVAVATNDAAYTDAVALLEGMEITGWYPKAYLTNTNLADKGAVLTYDPITIDFAIPPRVPVSIIGSIVDSNDSDSDMAILGGQISTTGIYMSQHAVSTLMNYAGVLKNLTDNGMDLDDANLKVVTKDVLTPVFVHDAFNVSTSMDTKRAGERREDIASVITNKIINFATKAYGQSGIQQLSKVIDGTDELELVIGTDATLAGYITAKLEDIENAGKWSVKVETSPNEKIAGKAYVTFRSKTAKDSGINPVDFGTMVWKPEINATYTQTKNDVSKNVTIVPHYIHVVNTAILGVFEVSGIEAAVGKINS